MQKGMIQSGVMMNRYLFEKKIAQGMGTELSLCRINHKDGDACVVKELIDIEYLDNLESEYEVLSSIPSHPGILGLIDSFLFKKNAYLVYEFCSSGDLFNFIKANGPLSEPQAIKLLGQLVGALQHARNYGFFHCDVKPENILLKSNGTFVLSDWDMARKSHQRRVSMHYGSTLSMAPEVILGQIHENSDVYSLGCLLHYCIFGKRVYELTSKSLPHERILSHLAENYDMPESNFSAQFQELLNRMLRKNPESRASLADLQAFLCGEKQSASVDISIPENLYNDVPDIIDPAYADVCRTKSIRRIEQNKRKDSQQKTQSLILAHRVILAYLRDKECQSALATEYQSSLLLNPSPVKSALWFSRANS